jgi:hypothetical protein
MRPIDGDAVMERIEQAYKDMGVDTHGIWNKQLAEILHSADVEEVREFLHSILGAITQSPNSFLRFSMVKQSSITPARRSARRRLRSFALIRRKSRLS